VSDAGNDGTGSSNGLLDASPPVDAGKFAMPPHDAAPRSDAGARPSDAGMTTARDAAQNDAAELDASTPADAASPVADAAPPVQDAARPDAGACLPGRYSGAFAGEITALFGFVRIDITGTISIEIAAAGSADQLPIKNGKLDGKDQDGNPITGLVGGTLNCTSRKLESGRITEGTYNRSDPILGGPPTTVRFSGTVTGNYSNSPPSAQGKWEVQNENGLSAGTGSWSVTLQP